MCDTLVALGNSTKDASIIFGKNSDRPNDEVQLISYNPRITYSKNQYLKCTYITIPQVSESYAVLLSQPWWMWGAEMGVNEFDVVIGNEAVYTHEPLKEIGLLGMDLLRLGLERGKSARNALDIITNLLEKFGQGGGCAYHDSSWLYHNSFIIADPNEAFVLETADNWWIAEKVKNIRSISNSISIRGKGDIRRKGIIDNAIKKGYCKDDNDFDFAVTFSGDPIPSTLSPYSREGKAALLLKENIGIISPSLMMDFLRDHQAGICMHGGFESTGSQVSHLSKESKSVHWFTGTSLPCVSIYKPYIFPIEGQKYYNPGPYSMIKPDWFWNKHHLLKPVNRKAELKNIENSIISELNHLKNQENKLLEEIFNEKLKMLNLKAWNKCYETIK
ncbi:MAG: C69 family dipeptidase [Candidatus Lokiarchaeota archaeon]|nr:C69 family dipeptidase [Candidatus Lokiarchaeota archaeon]